MDAGMFAVVQFPIADARGFAVDPDPRLDVPRFDKPATVGGAEFLRCFGRPVDRRLKPDPELKDERAYFRARGALSFVDLQQQLLPGTNAAGAPQPIFRRFFSNGEAVIRVEIGLRVNTIPGKPGSPAELIATAHELMSLPTRVPLYAEPKANSAGKFIVTRNTAEKPLIEQGDALARLFTVATSATLKTPDILAQRKLVSAGRPVAVIEFSKNEIEKLPAEVEIVDPASIGGAELGFARIWLGAGFAGVRFLCRDGVDLERLRLLRLCLLRLNAEREVLDRVVYWVEKNRIPVEPETPRLEALERYLNDSTRFVQRSTTYGLSQSAIGTAFDASEQVEVSTDRAELVTSYDGVRKMIWRKVELYRQSRGTATQVGGVQVVGDGAQITIVERIENSQIGAIGSGAQGDVSGQLLSNEAIGGTNDTSSGEATMNDETETDETKQKEAEKKETPPAGSTTVGNIQSSQVGAIGTGATGIVSGTLIVNADAVSQINGAELKSALNDLYLALGQDVPDIDTVRKTQGDANAAIEKIKAGKVEDAEGLAGKVKSIGDTLKQTNTTVEEGSKLWTSIKKVAEAIGPVVGGALTVAKWFAIVL